MNTYENLSDLVFCVFLFFWLKDIPDWPGGWGVGTFIRTPGMPGSGVFKLWISGLILLGSGNSFFYISECQDLNFKTLGFYVCKRGILGIESLTHMFPAGHTWEFHPITRIFEIAARFLQNLPIIFFVNLPLFLPCNEYLPHDVIQRTINQSVIWRKKNTNINHIFF